MSSDQFDRADFKRTTDWSIAPGIVRLKEHKYMGIREIRLSFKFGTLTALSVDQSRSELFAS